MALREQLSKAPFWQQVGEERGKRHPRSMNAQGIVFKSLAQHRTPGQLAIGLEDPELGEVIGQQ